METLKNTLIYLRKYSKVNDITAELLIYGYNIIL